MKPFLKWAGGKTQLLPELAARVPNFSGRYFEPFLGGGALFFHLPEKLLRMPACVLGDANVDLVETYISLRGDPEGVIERLRFHAKNHSEEHYYETRASVPEDYVLRAARFIYLNKTGFNGLYRVNGSGKFNVPWGKKAKFEVETETLLQCSKALHDVSFGKGDFSAAIIGESDFVYFDPPYAPLSPTSSFTSYTKGGFGPEDQKRLRDFALACKRRGAHVLLSNSSAPLIRELYAGADWKIEEVSARRNINSKGGERGAVTELLVS
jgi:DNA adenine methylase